MSLIVVGAAYALQRGVYIGSAIGQRDDGYFSLVCNYLLPSGVFHLDTGGWDTAEEAQTQRYCLLFLN